MDMSNYEAKKELRVLVCGGRGFTDREALDRVLDAFHAAYPIALLIHGGADGADSLAGAWAERRGVPVKVFPADWDAHGRAAGPMRNEQMLTEGQPDLVVAFPGGYGTSHMIRLAHQAGVPVWNPIPFEETPPKKWELRGLSAPDLTYVCRNEVDIFLHLPGVNVGLAQSISTWQSQGAGLYTDCSPTLNDTGPVPVWIGSRNREDLVDDILLIARAWNFAAERHADQRRKGHAQEPYINHLSEVAELVAMATEGKDANLIAAAILHDTVEDTATLLSELATVFNEDVANLVAEVTDDKALAKNVRKRRQVHDACGKSSRAKILKLADKTSNLRSLAKSPPADWSPRRKREYLAWALKVAEGLRGANAWLEARFDEAVTQLRQLLQLPHFASGGAAVGRAGNRPSGESGRA